MFYTILMGFVLTLKQGSFERTQDGNLKFPQTNNNTKTAFFSDTTFALRDTLDLPPRFTPGPGQLSKDGLKYYVPLKDTIEYHRLYVMSRNNLNENFDSLSLTKLLGNISKIDTFSNSQPTVTADEKTMVFTKSWDNNWNNNDLWIAERNSSADPFDSLRPLSEINIPDTADAYPWISPNGLHLYFTQGNYFYMVSRTSRDSLFGNKESLTVNFPTNNLCCFLTNNELEIYFKSDTTIYYSIRDTAKGNFSTPEAMPEFRGIGFVAAPSLTPDSSQFYLYNVSSGNRVLKFINAKNGIEERQWSVVSGQLSVIKDKIYLSVPNNYYTSTLLTIYDLSGRPKEVLYSGALTKGDYTFTPNIQKSGVYFVRLSAGDIKETKKLVLIK
ncbi:MAG: T9SS type A sorting domain-containing protein [bacterium]|nr:T9SS type A sorting domain-containing protein [bacterium]